MLSVAARRHLGTFRLDVAFATEHARVVLFGPSGAGKSLTLQCVAGFITPDSGRIAVGDGVLFDSDRHLNVPPWQRRVGMVLQAYTLLPHLTVGENVAYGLGPIWRDRRRVRAETLLAVVGLAGYADHLPAQLSGGQRQRVALAQALASEPRLLVLDEPFSAVDAPVRERLRRDLLGLVDTFQVPLIFVTHDFGEAYLLGQTIVIVAAGRAIQIGPPAEVARHPRTATVARLVGATNILEGEVVQAAAGRLTLRAGNLIVRTSNGSRAAGRRAAFSFRPEDVRIIPAGPDVPAARVTGVLPRNGPATVLLTLGDLTLEASVPHPPPHVGSSVGVEVADGAAQVLEGDGAQAIE